MSLTNVIGLIAAFATTSSFVPQVIKILKTKDTKGVSLVMYVIFTIGILLWLIYGLLLFDIPIIIANSVTLILASIILFLKIKNG